MESHKIDNFESLHNKKLPELRTLEGTELTTLQNRIFSLFAAKFNIQLPLEASKTQAISQSRYETLALSEGFDIREGLRKFSVQAPTKIYLNWSAFEKIDQIATGDFAHCFSDIWYPGADDIDLFDDTPSWMVSIYHDGTTELKYNTAILPPLGTLT